MNYQFQFQPYDFAAILCMVLATVSFCVYWFLFISVKFKNACYAKWPGNTGVIRHILLVKLAGFLILGCLPVCIFLLLVPDYNLVKLGIGYNGYTTPLSFQWIIGLGIPIFIVTWFGSRRPKTFESYPQIRVREWNAKLIIRYCLAWAIYMLGYEMMFRGLLLFPLADSLGVWMAIAINITLYMASHIPKGKDETYAALFFGPILCLITLQTGTIWAAWIIHVILAVSNSMVSLRFHPQFKIVKKQYQQ